MPEPLIEENVNPTPPELEDEFSYEITDDVTPVDPTLELQQRLAEMELKLKEAQEANTVVAPQPDAGLTELANAIKSQNTPKVPDANEEFTARFQREYEAANKDYHNDPLGNSTKINALMLEKAQHDMELRYNKQAATISQLTVQASEADIMSKYGEEIRDIASSLPPSGNVYQEAVAKVKMNHFDEIMAAKVAEQVSAQLEAAKPVKTPEEIAAAVEFTNSSSAPATTQLRAPKVQFSQREMTILEKYGRDHLMDWSIPGNKEYTLKKFAKHKAAGGTI